MLPFYTKSNNFPFLLFRTARRHFFSRLAESPSRRCVICFKTPAFSPAGEPSGSSASSMETNNPTITHRVITKDRIPVGNFHHRTYETTVRVDDCGGGDFLEQKLTMQSDVTMKVFEEFPDVHIVELNYRLELPVTETKYTVTYGDRA